MTPPDPVDILGMAAAVALVLLLAICWESARDLMRRPKP